jgi:P27 family predicted phage terminase small subunit
LERIMPGPPPQPAYLKLMKGNPGQRRIKPEAEPRLFEQPPEPPDFLSADARDEWRRLAAELVRLQLLTSLDLMLFAAYCEAFAHWKGGVEACNQAASADPKTRGLVVRDKNGNARPNPLLRAVRNAGDTMLQLAREFGLTPIARARLASAGFTPPNPATKFAGLIG